MDPLKNNNFKIEIDNIIQGGFRECTGLSIKVEAIEYREGGDRSPRKIPGKITYSPITLKWGATDSTALYDWYEQVVQGFIPEFLYKKDGSVVLLADDMQTEIKRWNFYGAWPSEYVTPALTTKDKDIDIAIESITLTCDRIELSR